MQKHPLLEQQPTSGANTAVPSTLGNNNGFGNVNNNNSNLSSIPSLLLMNNLNNGNRLLNNPSTNFSSSSFLNNSLSNNNTSNLLQQQLIDHHNQQIQQYLPNNNLKPNLLKTEFPINDFSTPMEHQLNTLNNVINNNNSNVNNLSSNNPFSLYNNPIINNNNNLVNQLFPVNNNNNNNNNLLNSNNNGLINNANINNNSNILNNPNLLLNNNNNPIVNNNNTTINNNGNTNNGMTTSQSNTSLSSLQTQQQANSTNNTAVNNMKKPRKVAKLACVSCRKAHACCEDKRPCSRCLVHGLECVDQVGKKRGRKKKSDKDENEEGNTEANNNGANSSNSNNNNSAVDAQANSVNGSNNNASVKKRKRRSSKKNQEENSKQENTSSQEINNNNNSVVINNNNNNNGMQLLSNNNNDASSLLATELTTPGANNIISRLMYNQSNNAIQNFPLFVNQPPEIQQLTQVLLRTPVDTFYLHCNNLNAAYNENQNNYLFGTPIQIPASSLNNNASCSSNAPNQQILNNQQMISGLSPNILNNLSFNNSLNLQHAFSPNSPLHDLIKDDEFLRFSPQSPLFESLIELDDEPLGIVNNTSSSSSGTSSSNEQQVYLPVTPNQQQQTNIEQQQIPALTPTTINTEENNNNDLIGLELLKDEGDFERLKKMSNEDLIKSLQIGDEIKQMIEASINQLKSFDSDNNLREKTYIEYLTQNFPISLLLKHKLSETAKRLEKREEEYDKREFESLEEEIRVLREENKKLKEENIRKSNESAMLSAINENLRNRFTEIISKEKEGKTTSNVNASNSSNQSNNSYPTTPTYIPSSLDSSSARSTEAKSLENSYQELCMLMENKDEMDSSSFGIMIMFPGGRLVSLNKTFLVKLGYEPGDLYDKLERWEDVVHPSSYPHVVAHVSRILKLPPAPRKSFKCKVKLRRKDGSILGAELYLCIVGGKLSYIPVFAIGYFLFEEIGKTIQ